MKRIGYLFLALLGSGIIAALVLFQHYASSLFSKREHILNQLHRLQYYDNEIDYEVLKSSFYLYYNYDRLDQLSASYTKELQKMLAYQFTPKIRKALQEYEKAAMRKIVALEKFQYLNSSVKNSSTYIIKMLSSTTQLKDHAKEKLILDLAAQILLAKNALDPLLIEGIKPKLKTLQSSSDRHLRLFATHISIFVNYFPSYVQMIDKITSKSTSHLLKKIHTLLLFWFANEVQNIKSIFIAIVIFYLISLGLIAFFIIRLDRENRLLNDLRRHLDRQAITDDLTKLRNRRAFKKDRNKIKNPFFALVDINGFKHYNDFYGGAMGDHILRQSAEIIKKSVDPGYNASFYRLGADEFGILIEEKKPIDTRGFAKKIEKTFKKTPIIFKGIETTISVSIAVTRKRPLLEFADLTMKLIKTNRNISFMEYDDSLHLLDQIKSNIHKSKILLKAIEQNQITPYFQGIYDTKTNRLVKYEVLARIEHNGKIESIFSYLPIAKELGLYKEISRQIFTKSFKIAHENSIAISLNLSMQDIENEEFLELLEQLLKSYPDMKLSLEILESEMVQDYNKINDLIAKIHHFGGKVGIDDFGSGYSNFMHIFNLDIDFIKIDGSLIKELSTNKTAYLIVQKIVSIAKELGIETIAEFVSSKEIYESVKEIEIDLVQGFYLHEPEPLQDDQAADGS